MALRFDFFDEAYYLSSYPDINAGVNTSQGFLSGLQHFERYGRFEGRVLASPYYNEDLYLTKYPDVAAAVQSGVFTSGIQHFTEFGYDERRSADVAIPGSGDVYLRKYPDVAAAVGVGTYKSWYDHFIKAGRFEGRSPTYFNEQDYIILNPDVAEAVRNGSFTSGFDHYVRFGQRENRLAFFSGTGGSDVITSFGESPSQLTGVDYETLASSPFDYRIRSNGRGEIDTLIGSSVRDDFLLGLSTDEVDIFQMNSNPIQLYVGGRAADYAFIRNFAKGVDTIQLVGSIENYAQEAANGNLSIFTRTDRDLVAVVEGITTPLSLESAYPEGGTFQIT